MARRRELANELEWWDALPADLTRRRRLGFVRERANDASEHPDVAAQAFGEKPACRVVVEDALLFEPSAERFAEKEDRVLERGTKVAYERGHGRAKRIDSGRRIGRRKIVLERASHLESHVGADRLERRLELEQLMSLREKSVVATADVLRRCAEKIALVSFGEHRARAVPEVTRERTRIGAEHAHHHVNHARIATSAFVEAVDARLEHDEIAEHPKE